MIKAGKSKELHLDNLSNRMERGYAPEHMDLMWRMLQHKAPVDSVGARNEMPSVKGFVAEAFNCAQIKDWKRHVVSDNNFQRPSDVDRLCGDASAACKLHYWRPNRDFRTYEGR